MTQDAVQRVWQLAVIAAAQVLVCNHFHLLGCATPLVAPALFLYMPLNANRQAVLLWAFALGMLIDWLSATPGHTASSLTVAAMARRPLLSALAPHDHPEDLVPCYRTLGTARHLWFVALIVAVHTAAYVALEYMNWRNAPQAALAFAGCTALTALLLAVTDALRGRRHTHAHGNGEGLSA